MAMYTCTSVSKLKYCQAVLLGTWRRNLHSRSLQSHYKFQQPITTIIYPSHNLCKINNNNEALFIINKNKRCFSSSSSAHQNQNDFNSSSSQESQEKRRTTLTLLTYISGFIGAVLLTAVGAREYKRLQYRAKGIQLVDNPDKRRSYFYKYRGYFLPQFVVPKIDAIHRFAIREDDIWVVTYPKAGTTWLQEVVYLIQNDADIEKCNSPIDDRFPYFEYLIPGLKSIEKMPSPRYIKSHLPLSLLPNEINSKKPKIIYLARNPKDTVVSLHHFLNKFISTDLGDTPSYQGTLDDLAKQFIDDKVFYGPWWKHVKDAWELRERENILFITYEEMKADLPGVIKTVASFLGKSLNANQINTIASHCSFDAMRVNKNTNYSWMPENGQAFQGGVFMRKGQVGDWKNHLSKDVSDQLNDVMATKLEPVGLQLIDTLDEN